MEVLSVFISIDVDKCMGHGRCYAMAPDLLSDDEEGYVAQRGQVLSVPEELSDQAREAVSACPEGAITLSEDAAADAVSGRPSA